MSDILDSLKVSPPQISETDTEIFANQYFGIQGMAKYLGGERDCNFLVKTETDVYTLKFANPSEDDAILDFQCGALKHIQDCDVSVPVPRIMPTLEGRDWAVLNLPANQTLRIRAFTYLQGSPITHGTDDPDLLFNLGAAVAKMDLALRAYFHPAARHALAWNTQAFDQLHHLTPCVPNTKERELVEKAFARFKQTVKPKLLRSRSQVIHNDV